MIELHWNNQEFETRRVNSKKTIFLRTDKKTLKSNKTYNHDIEINLCLRTVKDKNRDHILDGGLFLETPLPKRSTIQCKVTRGCDDKETRTCDIPAGRIYEQAILDLSSQSMKVNWVY